MPRWFNWREWLSPRRPDASIEPSEETSGSEPAPGERFDPRPVDEDEVKAEIRRLAMGLSPDAVDEATGHPLDNLINAYAELWSAQLRADYAAYCVTTTAHVDRANAVLEELSLLERVDRRRLLEIEVAREAALYRLGGHEPVPDAEEEAHG